jgi:hypothetical protein
MQISINLLKLLYRTISSTFRALISKVIRNIFSHLKPKIIIAYDNKSVRDGFGAQLHRILSLCAVAKLMRFRMAQPEISELTLHPLDPFNDLEQLRKYLRELNDSLFESECFFDLRNVSGQTKALKFDSIKLRHLLFSGTLSLVIRKTVILKSCEAHSVSDLNPNDYKDLISEYFKLFLQEIDRIQTRREIVMHYRQGPGDFAIYPGQKISRQMPIEYFLEQLESISKTFDISNYRLILFTDAPRETLYFTPPNEQLTLWHNTPGFNGKQVVYGGSNLEALVEPVARKLRLDFVIDRNSDPFQILLQMARATVLITSRSSLSYVGGLFNNLGQVYLAPDFWHPKLDSWIVPSKIGSSKMP